MEVDNTFLGINEKVEMAANCDGCGLLISEKIYWSDEFAPFCKECYEYWIADTENSEGN